MKKLQEYLMVGPEGVIAVILLALIAIILVFENRDLKNEKDILEQKIVELEDIKRDQLITITEIDQRNYLLEMEKDEWKALFYAEIGFDPYENSES